MPAQACGVGLNHHNFVDRKPNFAVGFLVVVQNAGQTCPGGVLLCLCAHILVLVTYSSGEIALNFPRDDKT